MKDFDTFISQLSETNATLDYFTNFEKARNNTNKIAMKLNQLNYLIGKENLRAAIKELYEDNPKTFEVLGILIAVRKRDKKKTLTDNGDLVFVESYFTSLQGVIDFIEQTGLAEVFKNKDITNLVDYVFGIEVGFDTNARKNRTGENMAKAVANKFKGRGISFRSEVYSEEFKELAVLGKDSKRFDFVIQTKKKNYCIEVNFYNTQGSKPNEVARGYIEVADRINQLDNYEFVWITDGYGWLKSKKVLRESLNSIPSIYNLKSMEEFMDLIQSES